MHTSKRFVCPICEYSCGRQKVFEIHLIEEHKFSSEEDAYLKLFLHNIAPLCACNQCNLITKYHGWNKGYAKFILGHAGRIHSTFDKETANSIIEKRRQKQIGQVGWSKGLTKENSEVIRKRSEIIQKVVKQQFEQNERISWIKGLTKETDERVQRLSISSKNVYLTGKRIPSYKGLTKETDDDVYQMSLNVKKTLKESSLRKRLDALKRLTPEEIKRRIDINSPNLSLITNLDEYTRDIHKNLVFVCNSCHHKQTKSLISAMSNRCDICDPAGSKPQIEIDRFVRSLGFATSMCDRSIISPYEIDIMIHEKKLGIEYNGLYFHSENFKNKEYHAYKSSECFKKDISLFHVFEDEWTNKQAICESMIRHKLQKTSLKIAARKCKIQNVNFEDRKKFFEDNHIDGNVKASHALGLYDSQNILVACLTLRKPSHKKYEGFLEIARFCTLNNVSVIGGLSKLTKNALGFCKEKNIKGVMTYVDTRHGDGHGYILSGFSLIGKTGNRFWWTGGKERIDRFKIRASKSEGLTEKEIADSLGVVKIWGCPNLIFQKLA